MMPITRAQNHRDHDRFLRDVALHGASHLDVVAIIRGDEVRADQEKDDFVAVDMVVDGRIDFLTSADPAVMPSVDNALALEHR